jgi:DNA repair protein RadC
MNTIKSEDTPKYYSPLESPIGLKPNHLSDSDLVGILTGIPEYTFELKEELTKLGGLRGLVKAIENNTVNQFVMPTEGRRNLLLALEFTKRLLIEEVSRGDQINSPQASRDFLTLALRDKEHEAFYIVYLDSKHRVIHHEELFRGTIDNAYVPIREVVKEALKHNAAAVVVAHNHPSGDSTPSAADKSLTEGIFLALKMVGVKLIDHLVIADTITSFAEIGALQS